MNRDDMLDEGISQTIEPDPDDADSALGDDISALTESVRSSVYDYQYENGRRYHAPGRGHYLLPNDEPEQERLDLLHHLFKMVLNGRLYTAPINPNELQRVLDVGTGTGIWAIEMADECPSALITGTDISPIQPLWVPPNCDFQIDDAETEWTFADSFDFIHARSLCGSISDWPKFYNQAFQKVKAGGWLEMQEHACWLKSDDGTNEKAVWVNELVHNIDKASSQIGKRLDVAHLHRQWMIDAGFVDVAEDVYKIPIGTWPKDKTLKEIGRVHRVELIQSIPTYSLAYYTRVLGYSYEQTKIMNEGVRSELLDRSLHMYIKWHFIRGRKPVTL